MMEKTLEKLVKEYRQSVKLRRATKMENQKKFRNLSYKSGLDAAIEVEIEVKDDIILILPNDPIDKKVVVYVDIERYDDTQEDRIIIYLTPPLPEKTLIFPNCQLRNQFRDLLREQLNLSNGSSESDRDSGRASN